MNTTIPAEEMLTGQAAEVGATETPPGTEPQADIAELLKQRRFNPSIQPPSLRPIYSLSGQPIATPGNLCTITSAVKTGKSAVVGAMAASAMQATEKVDCLGFTSTNSKSHALLHFDSEQSPDDHWHQISRTMKRAGLREPPPWFYSYCLTGLGCARSWEAILEAVRQAAETHGGIHSLLIDGFADLVKDVNDAAESNAFVAELHDTAIQRDCPIIGVIHFNPGGEKVRGHLGSQLERKAETNLRLDKTDEMTCIWSDKQRRAPIPKGTGPCFQWSDEAGMHVSVATSQERRESAAVERMRDELVEVFSEAKAMRYAELKSTVISRLTVSDRTAERKIAGYRHAKLISRGAANLFVFKV